ncbi:putative Divalent metal cation permease, ZupT-like [Nitrospira japonica]|uniref:Putative Divalent metal cation permease, ZupT-like n=1 Tax=Nitrospira japonica TaxID=1325564 RepID=A0A1W1IAQ0_9BACT|nr:zinc transporter ZupT [Nitrospira japonica]SLM50127.1 putative Divalent metal cation permease, ZupT-like [Nitrospira japonica]
MLELISLGAVAGLIPIYLGIVAALVLGRVLPRAWEAGLIGVATGVLLYLFFDLMHESVELTGARDIMSWAVFLGGLGVSLVGLVWLESSQIFGSNQASRVLSLPYMIALGMGFHNLGEGLAIGASYASGQWTLSMLLVAGFALHNGTEGFGIVGAAGKTPLNGKDIFLLGLLAGAPTCLGTLLSGQGVSSYLSILFYTLAAGSLLYVILSLTAISYTATRRLQTSVGILLGISLMFVTSMLLTLVSGIRS